MKITKYGHACIVLEDNGKKVVIDPGRFTEDFGDPSAITAVVVTHVHADHFHPEHLEKVFAASPEATLYTTPDVAKEFQNKHVVTVQEGFTAEQGPFRLRFSGDMHTLIHQSLPQPYNTAVCINDIFFYPGDSFTVPDMPIKVLAVPVNAPWARIGETMDYLTQVKPEICIPTHNGLLSDNGHMIYNGGLTAAAKAAGTNLAFLQPGESLNV